MHACIGESYARVHVHVSRPPVERKQIERIRKRGRLLRHRIRKRSSFRAWWWENAIRIWPAIRTGICFRAIRLFSLDWIFVDFLINAQVDRLLIEPDKWILYCNEEGIEVEFTGWYIFCKKIYICL